MILAIDVHYTSSGSTAAGVLFNDWKSSEPVQTYVSSLDTVVEYTPGQFYQRELPCILNLLHQSGFLPDVILIDGYVFLDGTTKPGLGKHLYDALAGKAIVIGVAKTPFAGISQEFQVFRGGSKRPLYVTCVGIDLAAAKANVLTMHGGNRLPTLLKTVDQLCRQKTNPSIETMRADKPGHASHLKC